MADPDDVLARLDRLEAENADLRRRLALRDGPPAVPTDASGPVSRRQLLRRGAATAVAAGGAAVLATIGRVAPARADNEPMLVGNVYDTAGEPTGLRNEVNDNPVFTATSAKAGIGILGVSLRGPGVAGHGHRAGVFTLIDRMSKAQVTLVPSETLSHPRSGIAGDVFVDKRARLWFCKGGTNWKRLA